jgi:hypothetical protein
MWGGLEACSIARITVSAIFGQHRILIIVASIRASRVKAMDETPIKAGLAGHGKMLTGYFWPVYGEHDEVCFPFHTSRSAALLFSNQRAPSASGVVSSRIVCRSQWFEVDSMRYAVALEDLTRSRWAIQSLRDYPRHY